MEKCLHKLTLPLYARKQKDKATKWITTKKLTGKMVYICTKCGAILNRGFSEKDTKAN